MANQVIQLQIHYRIGPQPGMNVLHFEADTGMSTPDVDTLTLDCIGGFVIDMESLWKACLPEDVQIVGYKGRRVAPGGGPTITALASGVFGTRSGNFSAGSVGPCVIVGYMQADDDWKAGRIFLPGVSEDDIDENQFSSGLITALDTLYAQLADVPVFIGPVISQSWVFGIYSRKFSTFSGAETFTTSGVPGTQRRRLRPAF